VSELIFAALAVSWSRKRKLAKDETREPEKRLRIAAKRDAGFIPGKELTEMIGQPVPA
jgi:hypothetical protein